MKGFVGEEYVETAWVSRQDKVFADYYRENGLELPEDYGELVNISYEAGRSLWGNAAPGHITIEELGGRGSYSLYPGGAQMTDAYQVRSDGSVARREGNTDILFMISRAFPEVPFFPGSGSKESGSTRSMSMTIIWDMTRRRCPG